MKEYRWPDVIRKQLDSLEATCLICLQTKPRQDVDRLLWCDECREAAQTRAASRSWYVALAVAVALALWIWLYVQATLVISWWIGVVLAAFYLSARMAREVLYAVARVRGAVAAPGAIDEEPDE